MSKYWNHLESMGKKLTDLDELLFSDKNGWSMDESTVVSQCAIEYSGSSSKNIGKPLIMKTVKSICHNNMRINKVRNRLKAKLNEKRSLQPAQ